MRTADVFSRPWNRIWAGLVVVALIPWVLRVLSSKDVATRIRYSDDVVGAHNPETPLSFNDMIGRPLFQPSRRPVMRMPVVSHTAPAARIPASALPRLSDPSKYTLTGTMVSDYARSALITLDDKSAARFVRPGDKLDGWKVAEIERDRLILEGNKASVILVFPRLSAGIRPAGIGAPLVAPPMPFPGGSH